MTSEYLHATYGIISPKVFISYLRGTYGASEFKPQESFQAPKPVAPERNKFSPVRIETLQDWAELRAEALNLQELMEFFYGRTDSQSPQFLNLVRKYRENVDKNLAAPPEIEDDSSLAFVEKLSKSIKKRFYTILESCHLGMRGNGDQPVQYYSQIIERVGKYFARIGLKSGDVKVYSDFREVQDYMEPTIIQTRDWYNSNKISEIYVQPHYFEYDDEDGEVQKFWIDGKCSVYKF